MGLVDLQRQSAILEHLQKEKKATVAELAKIFNASESTIRRDLTKLEEGDQLFKTYGGAIVSPSTQFQFNYNERLTRHVKEKKTISQYAASIVENGYSIYLDSGTTAYHIAEDLENLHDLTVITSGIYIVQKLSQYPGINIYMPGGHYDAKSQGLHGPAMIESIKQYAVDIAFISVDGFHPEYGLTTTSQGGAESTRTVIQIARRSIVVADSSKAGKRAFARACGVNDVDMIVTNKGIDPKILEDLRQAGVEVILV